MSDQSKDLFNNNFNDSNEDQDGSYVDLRFVVRLFFVSLFYLFIVGIVTLAFSASLKGLSSTLLISLVHLIGYSVSLLLIIKYASGAPLQNQLLSIRHGLGWHLTWLAPLLIICTLALCVWIEGLYLLMPIPEAIEEYFNNLIKDDVFSVLNIVIVAPVLEEVLCRGIILKGLLKNYSPDNAIGISAIFFGAIHLNPWQAIPAFVIGLFLGWIFYKTKSVLPGIIIHATVNATSVFMFLFLQDEQDIVMRLGIPNYILLCILSAVVFAAGCIIIKKKTAVE